MLVPKLGSISIIPIAVKYWDDCRDYSIPMFMMAFAVFATLYELFKFTTNADRPNPSARDRRRKRCGSVTSQHALPSRRRPHGQRYLRLRRLDDVGALHLGLGECCCRRLSLRRVG